LFDNICTLCSSSFQLAPHHLPKLITALLFYATVLTDIEEVTPQLLALQMLMNFATSSDVEVLKFCKRYKAQVVLHLSRAIDSPSFHVRQAAVQLSNAWILMAQ